MLKPKGFSTRIIHTPYAKDDVNRALHQPIYSNSAFDFESAEQMELAFQGRIPVHAYSRITNPTVENLELRIKQITGSLNVTALSSGMAAISNVILLLASTGSNIIASHHLFGNTYVFFESTIKDFGIETRFCDLTNSEEVRAKIDNKTVAVFVETITNPQLEVVDLAELSRVAHECNVPLIADSTLTPPNVFNAKSFGVDIDVISSTKGNIEKYIAWKDGKLVLDNESIVAIANKLSRWYNVEFEFKSNVANKYTYSGTFVGETLFQILDIMTIASPVTYKALPRKKLTDGTFSKQKIVISERN